VERLLLQMVRSLKVDDGEPERFKSGVEVRALLADLNRRLGFPPDSHLSYGQLQITGMSASRFISRILYMTASRMVTSADIIMCLDSLMVTVTPA